MHEQMLDLLQRLATVEHELGREAFDDACHAARLAVAKTVLARAEIVRDAPLTISVQPIFNPK